MKIEIKLPDQKYCNGCPCISGQIMTAPKSIFRGSARIFELDALRCGCGFSINLSQPTPEKLGIFISRPAICIERHGK